MMDSVIRAFCPIECYYWRAEALHDAGAGLLSVIVVILLLMTA